MSNKMRILGPLRLLGHQDWIRFGIRSRILRIFCDYDTCEPIDYEIDFFGRRYPGNLHCFLDWYVYFFGAYEKQELFLLRDMILNAKYPVFVDIGANVGQHTLFMSKYCEKVYSFEPYDPVRCKLLEKLKINGIQNVQVHGVGIGEKNDELDFFAPQGSNTGSGSFVSLHARDNNELLGKLKVVNGDDYFNNLEIERIDLIKIDVEGFERNVLSGMRQTIKKHRPILLMEFYEDTKAGFSGENELMALLPDGYKVVSVISYEPFAKFFCKSKYRFDKFEYDHFGGNILCVPVEISSNIVDSENINQKDRLSL